LFDVVGEPGVTVPEVPAVPRGTCGTGTNFGVASVKARTVTSPALRENSFVNGPPNSTGT
jgi:hypothetical protein